MRCNYNAFEILGSIGRTDLKNWSRHIIFSDIHHFKIFFKSLAETIQRECFQLRLNRYDANVDCDGIGLREMLIFLITTFSVNKCSNNIFYMEMF